MPNGKADANASADDDNDDGVDVQKILQHGQFQPEFLDDENFHDNTFDDSVNETGEDIQNSSTNKNGLSK